MQLLLRRPEYSIAGLILSTSCFWQHIEDALLSQELMMRRIVGGDYLSIGI
jgi:hypothetical protein